MKLIALLCILLSLDNCQAKEPTCGSSKEIFDVRSDILSLRNEVLTLRNENNDMKVKLKSYKDKWENIVTSNQVKVGSKGIRHISSF